MANETMRERMETVKTALMANDLRDTARADEFAMSGEWADTFKKNFIEYLRAQRAGARRNNKKEKSYSAREIVQHLTDFLSGNYVQSPKDRQEASDRVTNTRTTTSWALNDKGMRTIPRPEFNSSIPALLRSIEWTKNGGGNA